jgi:hypothetical protein
MNFETLSTKESVVKLLNDAHNEVNVRLGKRVYTLEEHYDVYALKAIPNDNTQKYIVSVAVTVVGGMVLYWICKHRRAIRM